MKADQFIKNLLQNGVELHIIDGGALRVRYDDGTLSQDDIERIRQLKAEIIYLLSGQKKVTRARGYGCGVCGNVIYQAVEAWEMSKLPGGSPWTYVHRAVIHWQCEGCGTVFEIINGTAGPQNLN